MSLAPIFYNSVPMLLSLLSKITTDCFYANIPPEMSGGMFYFKGLNGP